MTYRPEVCANYTKPLNARYKLSYIIPDQYNFSSITLSLVGYHVDVGKLVDMLHI